MPYNLARLESAILAFKYPKKVVVEFRNKKWLTPETKNLLKKLGCIFCITDSPEMNLIDWTTSSTAYIRLHGKKRWYNYQYSKAEIKAIAKFAQNLTKNKVTKIYILFNNDYYSYAIKNAIYLKELLNSDK
ncbi:MAG: DUF72 domain-containing protein [Gammaproteobacteria bacterium]|nr:DUF72 domain-containing protein [Gammaproteobacteria bacterium]